MHGTRTAGAVLTCLGLLGYVLGVLAPYPGRSASIVGLMVGITLFAVGGSSEAAP